MHDKTRQFDALLACLASPLPGLKAEDSLCLVLLAQPCRYALIAPRYDETLREFCVDGKRLHRFGGKAGNEVAILTAFQADGWPRAVTNPLGRPPDKSRRLYENALKSAVCRLNRCQEPWLIRFRSQPCKGIVTWEWHRP